ncbi:MAG: ParA family protein [Parvimonas sp.]|uniref:ParA family protein n=1 Tax=Parvimonas sp. TaxID=1944660 RepID=UPI002A766499|nr:ParA family protein [Parvimonas sp.]MDY3050692.1 ParA family protein [Parvimonas sp.]
MMKIITIGNQKGGVAKTTTTMNLGVALQELGKKVLLIDLDPQASLSVYLNHNLNDKYTIDRLIDEFINDEVKNVEKYIKTSENDKIDYIPSKARLSALEKEMDTRYSREFILKEILENEYFKKYEYILIDTCPSLNILLTNALTCSTDIIIPVQSQFFTMDSLNLMLETITKIKKYVNSNLNILGILPTMVDNTNMSKEVIEYLKENYANKLLDTHISRLVEASESTAFKISLVKMNKRLGKQYTELANEILRKSH